MDRGMEGAKTGHSKNKRRLKAVLGTAVAVAVALILVATYVDVRNEWVVRSVGDIDAEIPLVDLAIDGYDRIHVLEAISDGGLSYGVRYRVIGGDFIYSVSSPGLVGMALDVDSMGNAYFAIVGATPDPDAFYVGFYSYGTSGVGENKFIDSNVAPIAPSIAVDHAGYVHITYSKQGNLTYATNLGGVWTNTNLLSVGTHFGPYPHEEVFRSVVGVDSHGALHACYSSIDDNDIGYLSNRSGAWTNETIYGELPGGDSFDMVIDSQDNIHLCFDGALSFTAAPGIVYGFDSGSGWDLETASISQEVGYAACSIEVDSTDSPRIAYRHIVGVERSYRLDYLEKSGNSWSDVEVHSGGLKMGACHLALNHEDVPFIGFAESGVFKIATDSLTSQEQIVVSLPGILIACIVAVAGVFVVTRIK